MDEKLNVETTSGKEDISHIPNSMFDQNVSQPEIINRDYFEVLYDGELDPPTDQIVMTRSMYISSVADIEEDTQEEFRSVIKHIPLNVVYCLAFVVLAYLSFRLLVYFTANGSGLVYIAAAMLCGSVVAFILVSFFLTFSTIKRISRAKKARLEALETLEERKKECMLLGTYDAGR